MEDIIIEIISACAIGYMAWQQKKSAKLHSKKIDELHDKVDSKNSSEVSDGETMGQIIAQQVTKSIKKKQD